MTNFSNLNTLRNKRTSFRIHNVDLSIINSVRRIILAEIPTIALSFDPLTDKNPDVIVHTNKTSLHNEYLCHRISLIPMHFTADQVDAFDAKNYTFRLRKKNTGTALMNVTTNDIQIFDKKKKVYPKELHDQVFPKDDITQEHILITKLQNNPYNNEEGEEIDIEFTASKNIAKVHSRWSPVSQAVYNLAIDEDMVKAQLPEKLRQAEENKGSKLTAEEVKSTTTRFHALDAQRLFKRNKYDEPVEVEFKIETECGLTPEYLVFKALKILRDKFDTSRVRDESKVKIQQYSVKNLFDIQIFDEDHTMINVLQDMIYKHCIRDKGCKDYDLTYIGYNQPHPLYNYMIVKMRFDSSTDMTEDDVFQFLEDQFANVWDKLHKLNMDWIKFSKLGKSHIKEVDEFTNQKAGGSSDADGTLKVPEAYEETVVDHQTVSVGL